MKVTVTIIKDSPEGPVKVHKDEALKIMRQIVAANPEALSDDQYHSILYDLQKDKKPKQAANKKPTG